MYFEIALDTFRRLIARSIVNAGTSTMWSTGWTSGRGCDVGAGLLGAEDLEKKEANGFARRETWGAGFALGRGGKGGFGGGAARGGSGRDGMNSRQATFG